MELMSTKALLDAITPADVIHGKRMTDRSLRYTLRFLQLLNTPLFQIKPSLMAVTGCRIVKLSLEHGFCSESAIGLQAYGTCMFSISKNLEECLKWNQAALRLVENLEAKLVIPRIKTTVYVFSYWKEPLQAKIESLKENHNELLMAGDMVCLVMNVFHFCKRSQVCGRNLLTAEKECAALLHEMCQLRQMQPLLAMINYHLSILKLIGCNIDSQQQPNKPLFHLLGKNEIDSEDGLLQHALSNQLAGPAQNCYFDRLMLAFFFGNYSEAVQYAEKYSKCHQSPRIADLFAKFYQGVSAFRLTRLGDDKAEEWKGVGNNAISQYQTWIKYSEWNWENKLLLLEAELHACEGELEMAKSKFIASIDSARRHRFVHEEGLASELLGIFLEESGEVEESKRQFAHARSCYQKWGAFALADRLLE